MTRLPQHKLKELGLQQPSKYGSKKAEVDGHTFDSKREAHRYNELKLLLRAREIKNLELQPEFLLQEGFSKGGRRYRPIIYRADFRYTSGGKTVVEDVKGYKTKEYLIKKKLLLAKYPDIDFREV